MAIHAADMRMKNFSFFLIVMGVIIAAYEKVGRETHGCCLVAWVFL